MELFSFESAIEEIKKRLSLVDLVGNHTSLKQSGKNYKAICPFHDDKNPSLQISEEKGLYYCFSCGAGGDIFNFQMEYMNVDFKEAVYELASKLNIEIKRNVPSSPNVQSKRSEQLRTNERVLNFFHNNLLKSRLSQKARDYLASRGINIDLAKEFKIGFADDGWDNLLKYLENEKIPLDIPLELGLIKKGKDDQEVKKGKERQNFYDTFRNRIIFPIIDVNGDIIGFGGRVINEDNQPKYLNSSESDIYKKRRSFYGLFQSKDHIKKQDHAILVEGYMDFLSLYSAGIQNVVANLGTSFSVDHANYLKRYSNNVVVLYDGDESGMKASLRSGEILLQAGINLKIAKIPKGFDPDSLVKEKGKDYIVELVKDARQVTDHFIDDLHNSFKKNKLNRSETAQQVVEFAQKIADKINRSDFIHKSSSRFGFREEDIFSMLKNTETNDQLKYAKNTNKKIDPHEIEILKICLKYKGEIDLIDEKFVFDHINDDNIKEVLLKRISGEFEDLSNFLSSFNKPQINTLLSNAAFSSDELDSCSNEELNKRLTECVYRLQLKVLQKMKIDNRSFLSNEGEVEKNLKLYKDLLEREKSIKDELYKIKNEEHRV